MKSILYSVSIFILSITLLSSCLSSLQTKKTSESKIEQSVIRDGRKVIIGEKSKKLDFNNKEGK